MIIEPLSIKSLGADANYTREHNSFEACTSMDQISMIVKSGEKILLQK